MESPEALLAFWFATPGCEERWFKPDSAFDAAFAARFSALAVRAAAGALDHWVETPEGALALVLLLDQAPRNLHRGSGAAFLCDAEARAVARAAIVSGFDGAVAPLQRQFFYLPFEHSEDANDQDEAVRLFATLPPGTLRDFCIEWAERHRRVIRRFGRFPHRNAALGRASTPEEQAFLDSPEAPF